MSSVGRKLTLNFSKSRLKKKDNFQENTGMGQRRGSWGTLHPRTASKSSDRGGSMTNLDMVDCEMLSQNDLVEMTQIVLCFKEALYKLKELFTIDEQSEMTGEARKMEAHERLSELLCQLNEMKRFPSIFTSDLLMSVHHVITKVKLCNYEDDAMNVEDNGEVLDYIDKLAMNFSSSVTEYVMGSMDMDSNISRSKSCEMLCDGDGLDSNSNTQSPTKGLPVGLEGDQILLRHAQAVDLVFNRAKVWSKYAKDVTNYVEKRAAMEAEHARSLGKLAQGVRQTISEDNFLPFQSIFCTALEHDVDYSSKCQATYHLIQTQKFVEPLNERRLEHDKERKHLKDMWTKELKKMHEAVATLKKARSLYVSRKQEYEKAKDTAQRAENEAITSSATQTSASAQSSAQTKIEKKKKLVEDCRMKAMEAEISYKNSVNFANHCQQELETVKAEILAKTRDLLYDGDQVMKTATVAYFQLQHSAIAPVPNQYAKLREISERYESGCQYAEYIQYIQHLPSAGKVYAPPTYSFEPFNQGEVGRNYELRKPSTQSSGSGSDIQAFGEESPISPGHNRSLKPGGTDGDSDSGGSATSSHSTSPSASPHTSQRRNNRGGARSSSDRPRQQKFRGVLLSPSAQTHSFRKIRAPTRCRHCDSYVYFQGAECEKCLLASHMRCLETLSQDCSGSVSGRGGSGSSDLARRRMTTFGVDLVTQTAKCRISVPHIVRKCTAEIDSRGLDIKGIYRVSGVKSRVEGLCQSFESDPENVDLSEHNPHVIANVLKLYLRQLPEPLMTYKLYPILVQLAKDDSAGNLGKGEFEKRVKEAVTTSLPHPMLCTLAHLMHHLARVVAQEQANQMSASNLGIVFGPTLLRPNDGGSSLNSLIETPHQTRIVELLILQVKNIFADVKERTKEKYQLTADGTTTGGPLGSTGGDSWYAGGTNITGNLLAELESDPQFMQASSSSNNTPAKTKDCDSDNEGGEAETTVIPASPPKEHRVQSKFAQLTGDGSFDQLDNHTNSQNQRSTANYALRNDSNVCSVNPNTLAYTTDCDNTSIRNEKGKDKYKMDSVMTRKDCVVDLNKAVDTVEPKVILPHKKLQKAMSSGVAQWVANQEKLEEKEEENGGSNGAGLEIKHSRSHSMPLELAASRITEEECEERVSSIPNSVVPRPLSFRRLTPGSGASSESQLSTAYSPGLRKKLLPTQVRKSNTSPAVPTTQLLQPRPFSALVTNKPSSSQTPHVFVSSPGKTRKLALAPLSRSQDNLNMIGCDSGESVAIVAPSVTQFSLSASSGCSLFKDLQRLNKQRAGSARVAELGRGAPGLGGVTTQSSTVTAKTGLGQGGCMLGECQSPPYVSHYASPLVSPMASPRSSPKNTPRNSPSVSPKMYRRTASPLTIVSDREPQYV